MRQILLIILSVVAFTACSENYSDGNRIGLITKFSEKGIVWKTLDGEMNLTQTGMNSAGEFEFSIDRDMEQSERDKLRKQIDSIINEGMICKLTYREVAGWNWFGNRGASNYFITKVERFDAGRSKQSEVQKIVNDVSPDQTYTIERNGEDTIMIIIKRAK